MSTGLIIGIIVFFFFLAPLVLIGGFVLYRYLKNKNSGSFSSIIGASSASGAGGTTTAIYTPPSASTLSKYKQYYGYDITPGTNAFTLQTTDMNECATKCDATPGCVGWVTGAPGSGTCWGKSSLNAVPTNGLYAWVTSPPITGTTSTSTTTTSSGVTLKPLDQLQYGSGPTLINAILGQLNSAGSGAATANNAQTLRDYQTELNNVGNQYQTVASQYAAGINSTTPLAYFYTTGGPGNRTIHQGIPASLDSSTHEFILSKQTTSSTWSSIKNLFNQAEINITNLLNQISS